MKRIGWIVMVTIGAVAMIAGVTVIRRAGRAAPNPDVDIPSSFTPRERHHAIEHEALWEQQAEWTRLDDAAMSETLTVSGSTDDRIARLMEDWRPRVVDPDMLLTPGQTDSLLLAIARHALARSSTEPDVYLELLREESSRYSWITGEDDYTYYSVTGAYRYEFGAPPSTYTEPAQTLRTLWRQLYGVKGHRFAEVGHGEGGALINVRRVHSFQPFGLRENQDAEYWLAVTLSVPVAQFRTSGSHDDLIVNLLKDRDSLLVAYTHILVRSANGILFDWRASWTLDPDTKDRWYPSNMDCGSSRVPKVIF